MPPVSAGKLDRPISIQERADADAEDEFGSVDRSKGWATVHGPVWAEYMAIGASERVGLLAAHNATGVARYRCRFLENISASMAVLDDGVRYEIVDAASLNRREDMIITAVQRQPGTGTR